jgi:hypothetical protein
MREISEILKKSNLASGCGPIEMRKRGEGEGIGEREVIWRKGVRR